MLDTIDSTVIDNYGAWLRGLGHSNESTTQVYLSDIENTELDKANKLLISSV